MLHILFHYHPTHPTCCDSCPNYSNMTRIVRLPRKNSQFYRKFSRCYGNSFPVHKDILATLSLLFKNDIVLKWSMFVEFAASFFLCMHCRLSPDKMRHSPYCPGNCCLVSCPLQNFIRKYFFLYFVPP